jgi:CRP/FNR family cyclic AMP-dependent transcriptional regulator
MSEGRRVVVPAAVGWQDRGVDPKALEGIGAFSGLSGDELEKLAAWTFEIDIPAGEELTKEGRLAHEFFVIEDGAVEVRQDGERIAEMGPGDFFGEIGLLETDRRTATVIATTPVRLIVMSAREFRQMELELPLVATRVRSAVRARLSDS